MIGKFGDEAEATAIRGLAGIDGDHQAHRRVGGEARAYAAALLAAVESAAVLQARRDRSVVCASERMRPRQVVAEFERHGHRSAVAMGDRGVAPGVGIAAGSGSLHADAFAVGHQQRAQAGVAWGG